MNDVAIFVIVRVPGADSQFCAGMITRSLSLSAQLDGSCRTSGRLTLTLRSSIRSIDYSKKVTGMNERRETDDISKQKLLTHMLAFYFILFYFVLFCFVFFENFFMTMMIFLSILSIFMIICINNVFDKESMEYLNFIFECFS